MSPSVNVSQHSFQISVQSSLSNYGPKPERYNAIFGILHIICFANRTILDNSLSSALSAWRALSCVWKLLKVKQQHKPCLSPVSKTNSLVWLDACRSYRYGCSTSSQSVRFQCNLLRSVSARRDGKVTW